MPVARTTALAFCLMASVAVAQTPAPPAKPAAPATPSASDNKVVTTEALHVLVLPMKGAYAQHQSAFERLGTYIAAHGVSPLGAPIGRYLSDPSVAEAELAWEVGFPVAATVKAEAPFETKDIPGGLNAIHVHKGSYEELATAWPAFMQWVIANGYRPVGPATQIFQGNLGSGGVEMRIPVEK